jgi:fumarate hydratase class II
MNKQQTRKVKDSMGEIEVPMDALWGAQTQRALENFSLSDLKLPRAFIHSLALIKAAAGKVNADLVRLSLDKAKAIMDAAESVALGEYDAHFPLDIFQTGSGTSTNMNANEVIAHLATLRSGLSIHPNDDVNMSQSSNDVIPSTIHLSCSIEIHEKLLPALQHLLNVTLQRAKELDSVVKTGRTHLMDALPLTFGQELSGWAMQILQGIQRIEGTLPHIQLLCLGGTAVGTGLNAHPEFGNRMAVELANKTGIPFAPHPNYFAGISAQDNIVALSGQLRTLAITLSKIANDLRWMNSGPLTGLNEIALPAMQPGSSIMPGKVNPVIPEAVMMACAHIIGNDKTIALGGLSGNFQLNTMLPLIAYNILQTILLLTNSAQKLAEHAIGTFIVKEEILSEKLAKNPILVTALNPIIGYEKGAAIAKRAYQENLSVLDVAKTMTELSETELKRLLDPKTLTHPGNSE